MGDPRITIASRELSVLRKEKTIVLALLIQLFIAAFSSFLVVGLVSLYDPTSVDGYTVDVAVTGDATDDLLAVTDDQASIRGVGYPSEEAALDAFDQRRVDAVLATEVVDDRVQVAAVAPDSNIRTTLVVVQLRDALRGFERAERLDRAAWLDRLPLDLPPEATTSPYFGFTYTVLVPLLLFLPVFISGSIAVDSITEEFDRGTLELLRVAPVSLVDIVDGKLAAAALLAPAQAVLWLLLLEFNGTQIENFALLVVLVAAFSLLVVSVAIAIALATPDRRSAQFVYSLAVLLLFGGTTLLPSSPANAVARLSIGSVGTDVLLVVALYVALAVAGYAGVRVLTAHVDETSL
ncbi:ABC-2 family transporter protein [Halogranum gelatinilyticum]|uniref:ABC-2 family transporter protein n=1 Tax=Halogranum gelatinilyticum TaxID=660521 RepID=A0A1G9ZZ48_9EURY|nr:ABC transporter permease [Halogranum gelatinilyticum]SDN26528.1 ABC-2 family transporter protein [Halogranum gelatinilyticum]